jgi:hypothetical protein
VRRAAPHSHHPKGRRVASTPTPVTRTGERMAAADPERRRANALTAARARLAQLTPDQRQAMTQAARDALRARDLRIVDQWATRVGRHPLPEPERQQYADELRRRRARNASAAAAQARRARAIRKAES